MNAGRTFVLALSLTICAVPAAVAERLVSSLSSHRVLITSNFTGEELVLFGTVENDPGNPIRRGRYDIVATVVGPRQQLVAFRKERMVGIWMNTESRDYAEAPSFLGVLATRPIDSFADPTLRRRLQLGLDYTPLARRGPDDDTPVRTGDPFREALVRIKRGHALYFEQPSGITFLAPSLFRASIPLPGEAPVGGYEVDLKLFADRAMIARASSAFEIVKVGFERFVAASAQEHGLLYGLATAMMALVTGWLAAVIFRRD